MKTAKVFLAALLLAGSFVSTNSARASDGVITKDEFTPGNYCHMKFPAIQERTLSGNNPVLKNQDGDVIDFYGPCNENPTGQAQVHAQKLDLQKNHYND